MIRAFELVDADSVLLEGWVELLRAFELVVDVVPENLETLELA